MGIKTLFAFPKEHNTCINNTLLKETLFFKQVRLKKGEFFSKKERIDLYYLFFLLEGEKVRVHKEENVYIQENAIFCEQADDNLKIEALEDTLLILHGFGTITNICDRSFPETPKKASSRPQKIEIKTPLRSFFNLLCLYLDINSCCFQVSKLKHLEIFMLFRRFYSQEEFYALFEPIINGDQTFKKAVKEHFVKAKNVEELAQYCNKSLSTFTRLFKKHFNDNPHNWMRKQKLQMIVDRLSQMEIPLSEIAEEFDFSSFSYFSQFCKKNLGVTPRNFRLRILKGI